MIFLILLLVLAYYFGHKIYVNSIGPMLPEGTPEWLKKPDKIQFIFAVLIAFVIFHKKS